MPKNRFGEAKRLPSGSIFIKNKTLNIKKVPSRGKGILSCRLPHCSRKLWGIKMGREKKPIPTLKKGLKIRADEKDIQDRSAKPILR